MNEIFSLFEFLKLEFCTLSKILQQHNFLMIIA